jgi:hypothetical protein
MRPLSDIRGLFFFLGYLPPLRQLRREESESLLA